jgi:hypothetical protein
LSKITAILGSALFFLVAPAMLAGVIPWLITHWEFRPPFLAAEATRLAGLAFIIAGVPGLLDSFARFALQGLGTPASDRATTQSRGERIISLCAQSDLCCSRCRHSWPGGVIR